MSPPKSKPRRSIKPTPGQLTRLSQGLDVAEALYGPLLADWHLLTPEQRDAVLEDSPILARLAALTEPLRGV